VALKTFWGEQIYCAPPSPQDLAARRARVHAPYHAKLQELLQAKIGKFGHAVLVDAHSVPSRANLLHGELHDDIFLGDRDGRSNSGWLTAIAERTFRAQEWRVVRNNPYKGGYITDHYGKPPAIEALQIEMCERLYMDESDPAGHCSTRASTQPGQNCARCWKRSTQPVCSTPGVRDQCGW